MNHGLAHEHPIATASFVIYVDARDESKLRACVKRERPADLSAVRPVPGHREDSPAAAVGTVGPVYPEADLGPRTVAGGSQQVNPEVVERSIPRLREGPQDAGYRVVGCELVQPS